MIPGSNVGTFLLYTCICFLSYKPIASMEVEVRDGKEGRGRETVKQKCWELYTSGSPGSLRQVLVNDSLDGYNRGKDFRWMGK
jgi:hypothetical protein